MNDLIPRQPKRKRQPTAAKMREQLALAADALIDEREMSAELEAHIAEIWRVLAPVTPWQRFLRWWRA